MTKRIGNIASALVFAVLLTLCLGITGVRLSGLGTYIVTGGSMEPSIHKGSLVIVQPVDPAGIAVGDVITFQQYDQTTTHRVIGIVSADTGLVFQTKGDANIVADPLDKTFPGKVGVVRGAIPVAGSIASSLQAYWRLLLTLVAAITFFSCAGALVLRKGPSPAAKPKPVAARRFATVAIDPDEAWSAHVAWLQRDGAGRLRRRAA
jgi:signal peptidase